MIDTKNPAAVWDEICASERKLESELASHKEIVRRYHGGFYKGRQPNIQEIENHGYMWMASVKAQILAANPRWSVKAQRDMSAEMAVAFSHALNRVTVETGLYRTLDKLFVDFAFRRAACMIERKPGWKGRVPMADRGTRDGVWHYPFVSRLDVDQLHYDSLAREWEDTEFRGHRMLMSKTRLSKMSGGGWRKDVISGLRTDCDVDELRPDDEGRKKSTSLERDDLLIYCEWFPEEQQDGYSEEDGYFGTIRTYAYAAPEYGKGSKSLYDQMKRGDGGFVEIRDPQAYFGCKSGPYVMWGQDYVPGHVEPLSQFVAMEQKLRSLNVRAGVMQRAMEAYKRLIIIAGKGKATAAKVQSGKHDHIIGIDAFKKEDIFAGEIGGLTDQMLKMFAYDNDTLNQLSGITDAMKGNVNGDATATENAIAAGGATARLARLDSAWERGVAEVGRDLAQMMFYDDEFAIQLPPEAAQALGLRDGTLVGGREEGQKFDDLEIEVVPRSMSFPNESQEAQRAVQDLDIYMAVGNAVTAQPWMDWDSILTELGDKLGNPKMRRNVNYQMADQMAGLQIGMQVQGASSEPKADVRLSSTSPKTRNGAQPGTLPGTQSGQKARRASQPAGAK